MVVLHVLKLHISGILLHVFFCNLLLFLTSVFERYSSGSFIRTAICDEHRAVSDYSALTNSAAMNIFVRIFRYPFESS